MEKKKGFTLVELLAVIVILAIILVIAVPQIIRTIDAARLSSFKSTAKLLLNQAEKQHLTDQTLKVNVGNVGDVTYEGVGETGENSATAGCGVLAKLGSDYSGCKITVNGATGVATIETLTGADKFAGYTCTGATTSTIDEKCSKTGESTNSGSSISALDAYLRANGKYVVSGWQEFGQKITDDVTVYTINESVTEAIDGWDDNMPGYSRQPFYLIYILDEEEKIKDSYVGFVINDEWKEDMKTSYYNDEETIAAIDNLKNGSYAIKGGDGGASYAENIATIKEASNYANQPEKCSEDEYSFYCWIGNFYVNAGTDGNVSVNYSATHCDVFSSGDSGCGYQ